MTDLVERLRKYGDDPYDVSLGEIAEWFHKSADRIEELEREVTQLQAEAYKANRRAELADGWRDHDKERADKAEKELERWRQGSIDTWGAMNAMRNAINEHVAMPSIEGDLLKGPENSVFCATVADAVIGAVLSLRSKLTAEKALADRLWVTLEYFGALRNGHFEQSDIAAAYRKARGM